ncbi:MAG: hypothetical protein LBT64_02905 [Puniceicoccales bacterium]|jgi:hypothetical protein|nr:hypothetical protein [Puniceicoccales bacterium]
MQPKEVIKEFGSTIGFNSLEINENGVVHLFIHKVGNLFIDEKYRDESGNYVFIYLLRTYEHPDGDTYRRALELCDYQSNEEFLVNPVLHKDQALGFAIKHSIDNFDLNVFRKIIEKLKGLQDRLGGEVST